MYTVRIFETTGHTDTEYATADLAFGAVFSEPLPLPELIAPMVPYPFAIFKDGICIHIYGEGQTVDIDDPL